jgi:hypothetical protein
LVFLGKTIQSKIRVADWAPPELLPKFRWIGTWDVRKAITMNSSQTSKLDSADQGLQKLMEGNQRFLRGEARFPTVCKETLADLAKGQQPFATILGCSDSRVPPELIFDANFGELFIVRVAET